MKLSTLILEWYRHNSRELPWREMSDPYSIWISEVMLQQTRVDTVIPYFERWMKRYPTVFSLADSNEQDVLALWEGLGYYSRARNLLKSARIIVSQFSGQLPENIKLLRELPGIGSYTAAAIASIAFGQDEPAIDGNVRRVFSRVFLIDKPLGSIEGELRIKSLARDHLPPGQADDYNQALMDLGANICTPREPSCHICPLNNICQAYLEGRQKNYPVSSSRPKLKKKVLAAAVIRQENHVLLFRRPSRGLLGGMWEYPNIPVNEGTDHAHALKQGMMSDLELAIHVKEKVITVRHAYTHFHLTEHAYLCELILGDLPENARWVLLSDLNGLPMGKVDRLISSKLLNS